MCSPEVDLDLGMAVAAIAPILEVFVFNRKEDTFADTLAYREKWRRETGRQMCIHIWPLQIWTGRQTNCNVKIHISVC